MQKHIQRSVLLTQKQKKQLLKALPSMTPSQKRELEDILSSEQPVLQDLAEQTISIAVQKNDTSLLKKLGSSLQKITAKLLRTEERFNKKKETELLEHFFDEPST